MVKRMSISRMPARLRARVESFLGIQIKPASRRGVSLHVDIQRAGCMISDIFDVGAHHGETAKKFAERFPAARIRCFEPVSVTYARLCRNVAPIRNISCHRAALSDHDGEATIYLTGESHTSSLVAPATVLGAEVVPTRSVDSIARELHVDHIDLLKIDAEGADLDVLRGARRLLEGARIAFVLVELSFNPGQAHHVLFDDVRAFLQPFGFAVFGVYDQDPDWYVEQPLRYANVCFSNEAAFEYAPGRRPAHSCQRERAPQHA